MSCFYNPDSRFNRFFAYLRGMVEFRNSVTHRYDADVLDDAYEYGRDRAHALTLRYWDN